VGSEMCIRDSTFTIQKSTYFPELSNKIATLMRKNFNPEM
jgi:hypothetical protein